MVRGGRAGFVLSVVFALVVAGCVAPAASGPAEAGGGHSAAVDDRSVAVGTPTPAERPPAPPLAAPASNSTVIETVNFEPRYDPGTVLGRVERLRGLNVNGSIHIHEYRDSHETGRDLPDQFASIRPAGAKTLQLYSSGEGNRTLPLGYTMQRNPGEVHVYLMNESDLAAYDIAQEVVLAHELTHVLQFQNRVITPSRKNMKAHFGNWTTDAYLVSTAVIEGDAMAVTEAYHHQTQTDEFVVSASHYNRTLPHPVWSYSLGGTPYFYGHQYFERTNATAADRTATIRSPPNSTAGLLHPNESDELAPLPPEPAARMADGTFERIYDDRVGELTIRHTLRMNGFAFERAASVGDGWANGHMYYFRAGNDSRAVSWVTVWENQSEADEFARTWRAMLDAKNATAADGVVSVPGTETAPASHYVVERDGETVRVVWAERADHARRLAAET